MNTEPLSPLLPNCSERPVPVFLSAAYRLQPAVPSDIEEQIEKLTAQPPSKKTLTIDVR